MARTSKRPSKEGITTNVGGGVVQGVIGAQSVVIENLTFYSRAAEEPAQTARAEPIGPCPYPGLAYFGPSDANLFFGRDTAITRLAEAVGRQSFTALVGASGSGKSSVVLAGLAPRLHGDSAGNWRFSHFRIGTELESNPFLALARALAPLYVASDSDVERLKNTKLLAASLAAGELTLRDVFADCRSRNKGRRILLIADQFEEAFTLVADNAIRERFIDVLLAGFPDPAAGSVPDICLILTMRADFYGRALRHRPLADALQNHVENLGPMNRGELQAAIVRSAENAEVAFEPGLVETLLDTVQSKPGGLPLLQFALREMWGRQERKKITRKSYDEIGGVEGALAQRAETVFAGLTKQGADPAMDKAFQRLFTRLVTLGEGQEDTRRVVERAELGDEVWGLAQRLAGEENRLVVTNASSARETAEVVHEALIRHWPKLVDWINRDRTFQSWLRQIELNIELWSADPTDEGPLLRGGMLVQATEWLALRRDDLSPRERAYVEASTALQEAVRGRARRGRTLIYVLLVGIIAVLVGWINQAFVKEQISWYMTTRPYRAANVDPYVLKPEAERALKPLASFRECAKDCPEMIVIPAGEFVMGSPRNEKGRFAHEGPQHSVTIAKAFAVSKFNVTFDDWDACISVGGCPQVSDGGFGRHRKPIINVTWHDAQQYVAWFSKMTGKIYRLLSEAEWEYAARAGTTTAYPWGDEIGKENANCNGCGSKWDNRETSPVGSFKPNAFGLYDMAGNVWQWVQDCYNDNYNGAPTDGTEWTSGDCSRRVGRTGSWGDSPRELRAAFRNRNGTVYRNDGIGFRVGRTLIP
jgi:formylglycine-generating enzyme required for sulfatase activity/ABC-type dipeptide/oligopeptide/nickel transport system ATPase component